jgi:hypothetical protein
MKRRDFFIRVGGTLLAVPAVLHAVACGGDDDGSKADAQPAPASFQAHNEDNAGHTHTLTILCRDLTGNGVTYTSSSVGHVHMVPVSASELAMIAAGQTVMIMTTSLHNHTWVITKPAAAC